MKFIFWKKHNKEKQHLITKNPFTAGSLGREEWNDRYFSMKKQIIWWQIAFTLLSVITFVLALAAFKHSTQSHIQPVVVEVCNGEIKSILPFTSMLPDEDKLIKQAIYQFIANSRTIIADADAQKLFLDKAYAFSAGNTISFLSDYYHQHNPFELASQITTQVVMIDSMKISPHTWQVTWEETKKNVNGNALLSKTKWVATITSQRDKVNPKFINENPLGIYFTQITWSQLSAQNV